MRDTEERDQDTDEAVDEHGGKAMGFLDHLEELRSTIIKSISAFVIGIVIVAIFFEGTISLLNWPLDQGMADKDPGSVLRVTNTFMAAFSVYISVGALGAITLSMPFIVFFFAQFVAPALTPREKRLLAPAGITAVLLFLTGGAFSYFLLMPSVVSFSIDSNAYLGTTLMLALDSYYSMLAWLVIGMGVAFQFPMVIQILVYLDIVTVTALRQWRRVMILVCFIVAAFITPTPDPLNMTICALPLCLLYEAAIWVAAGYTTRLAARSRE